MLKRQDIYYVKALERIFQDRYRAEYPLAIVNVYAKRYVVGKEFVTKNLYDSVFKSVERPLGKNYYDCMHFLHRLNQDFNGQCNFRLMSAAVMSEASEIWGEDGHPGYSELDVMRQKEQEGRYGLAMDWCSTKGFSIGNVPPFRFCADLDDIRRYIDPESPAK